MSAEKYDWQKGSSENDLLHYIIITAFSKSQDKEFNELIASRPTTEMEVELKVNGRSVPVVYAFKLIQEQDERRIKSAAKELVEERLDEFLEHVREFEWLPKIPRSHMCPVCGGKKGEMKI